MQDDIKKGRPARAPKGSRLPPFLFCLLLLAGCGRSINRAAERRIRDALPDVLGPAKQYRVHVENAPERTIEGRLANVTIDGDDVQLSNGLLLDQIHLELTGVEVDMGRRQVRKIEGTRFAATLSEASLDEFIAGESPEGETIRRARITLRGGNMVTISAERVVLGVGVPFQLSGPLRLAGPQRIEIDPTRLTVIGIPIAGVILNFLKGRFESAIDLTTLPLPIQVTGVQTTAGKLTISGSADVNVILQRAREKQK
jgi:hypothetical protein